MTTSLYNAEVRLSKELGDYFASTTTSNGDAGGVTLVDTALKAYANDWAGNNNTWVQLVEEPAGGATSLYEERKVSSLDNSTGTLTCLAFAEQVVSGIDYRIHRLFPAAKKNEALVAACYNSYPFLYNDIWDESHVTGNWLKDGSFERWSTTTNLVDWAETTLTATQTTTSPYYKHGTTSAKLSTLAGTLSQAITNHDDLKYLAGRSVTFTVQGWCNTASALRISINDGVTQTYSDYHAGDSAWTHENPRNDNFYVTQVIDTNPTQITFTIHLENAAATAYVDDARAISGVWGRTYIGELGLVQNRPVTIAVEQGYLAHDEPWHVLRGARVDPSGYLWAPTWPPNDRRMRILGVGFVDFKASGVSSTAWTATVNVDSPEIEILVAEAALYLYTNVAMPNDTVGDRKEYERAAAYWAAELQKRQWKFGMKLPPARAVWSV